VASNLDLKVEQAQKILEIFDPMERLKRLAELLGKEIEVLEMQHKIQSRPRGDGQDPREYYLREQLKAIQKELERRTSAGRRSRSWSRRSPRPRCGGGRQEAKTQLGRLSRMHPDAAEASVIRTYLDWLIDLPWAKQTKDNLSIKQARRSWRRITTISRRSRSAFWSTCGPHAEEEAQEGDEGAHPVLRGASGRGKTSLGRSIARALGRKFVRISLGGVRDEAEIRGHRRTYIGALPGKIIQGIKQPGPTTPSS